MESHRGAPRGVARRKCKERHSSAFDGRDPGLVFAGEACAKSARFPAQERKRIVFFDGCAFARIYLNNGKFVQYNFSIASPIYISTDPSYEELNPDYTKIKNKIFDSLEENIGAVLLKYKKDIASK